MTGAYPNAATESYPCIRPPAPTLAAVIAKVVAMASTRRRTRYPLLRLLAWNTVLYAAWTIMELAAAPNMPATWYAAQVFGLLASYMLVLAIAQVGRTIKRRSRVALPSAAASEPDPITPAPAP